MPISASFSQRLLPRLQDLLGCYPTPFHVYDEVGILATHQRMASAFGGGFRQYFAVKALPNPHVLRSLLAEGSGLDCSSPVELNIAMTLGARGEDIVFTSNNTTAHEFELASSLDALVTFDDRDALLKCAVLPDVVTFRVAPDCNRSGSALMGSADSKFGVPRPALADAYQEARARGATRFGMHGMTCANELDRGRLAAAATALFETAREVSLITGIEFDYMNIGGGLGIPYRPEDPDLDFELFAAEILAARASIFGDRTPRLLMECGRFVTGPHGVLVARVTSRVQKSKEVVGLDASMSSLMRPGFYRDAYHHITLPFIGLREPIIADVVGSLCENIDKFAVDRSLPAPRERDVVLIHDTGAHGHAMGFTYNGRLRPAEFLLRADGNIVLIRRAETIDDYLATVPSTPKLVIDRVAGEYL